MQLTAAIERLPVATIVHLIVTVVLGVDLLIDGHLSSDATLYAAIVEGGNAGVAIGRGLVRR